MKFYKRAGDLLVICYFLQTVPNGLLNSFKLGYILVKKFLPKAWDVFCSFYNTFFVENLKSIGYQCGCESCVKNNLEITSCMGVKVNWGLEGTSGIMDSKTRRGIHFQCSTLWYEPLWTRSGSTKTGYFMKWS